MRITRLYLRNYRVYEQELDLELPGGLIGVYGPNGAGKSYLIESVLWTLWGRSRTGKDQVRTADVNDDCITEVEFEHEGHLYLVRRTISGINHTVKAEAHADRKLIAHGVRDTKQFVHSVLGLDDAAFRASVFAEQKQLAAFSDHTAAERRKLVLQLLGITPLDAARDEARKDAREAEKQLERTRSVLPDLDVASARVEQATAAAEVAEHDAASEETAATTAAAALSDAEERFDRLDAVAREHEILCTEGKAARAEHDTAARRVEALTGELAQLATAAERVAELRPGADGIDELEAQLPRLTAVIDAERAVAALPVVDAPDAPDDDALDAARAATEQAVGALAEVDGRLGAARAALQRADAALARSSELSGEADCPVCGQSLGDAFEQVQAHRAAERAEADAEVQAVMTQKATLVEAATTAKTALDAERRRYESRRTAWSEFEKVQARRVHAEEALEQAIAAAGRKVEASEVDAFRTDLAQRKKIAEECRTLEVRLERRPAVEHDLEAETTRMVEASERRERLLEKVRALEFDTKAMDAARAVRGEAKQKSDAAGRRAHEARVAAVQARGHAETEAQRFGDARQQHELLDQLAADTRHLSRVADLLNSFRNSIVGRVGPRLAAQAAELFDELTDHEYDRLEVDPDTYEIQIRDAGSLYGMDRFSGSETDLANLALRVAISEQVRFQSGGAVGLLVLDEVFGPLDDERKERMLLALERLRARFRQVLVVTHDTNIKEQLPNAVEVVKLPGRRATARLLT